MHDRSVGKAAAKLPDLEAIADEFLARSRAGQRPDVDEYVRRYPQMAERIREILGPLAQLERLAPRGSRAGDDDSTARRPERIGEYAIVREVGRGGMGIVYEAVHERLGRRFALKVLPSPAIIDEVQLERFRREAQAAAQMDHPNIVPVFDVGDEDGVHYYAMQFVDGHGLDVVLAEVRRLRSGASGPPTNTAALDDAVDDGADDDRRSIVDVAAQLSSDRVGGVARIGRQVAQALAFAHDRGVLHRDVKPSNILLDESGNAHVTDFGLAKVEGSDDLTHTGDLPGTLRYMAPERLQGWSDPRSDVYGLGLTLYECLTLRPAFGEQDRGRLVQQLATHDPPPPRKIEPGLPRDLETIVWKAIAKEPAHRYASAEAMAEDLRRYLSGEPILARRASQPERVWLWARRNPTVAGLTAVAVLLLVSVAAVSSVAYVQTSRALRREAQQRRIAQDALHEQEKQRRLAEQLAATAERNAVAAHRNADEATHQRDRAEANFRQTLAAVDEFFTTVGGSRLVDVPGTQPLQKELLESALVYYQSFIQQHADDPRLQSELADAYQRAAWIQSDVGDYDASTDSIRMATAILTRLVGEDPDNETYRLALSRSHMNRGTIEARRGDFEASADASREALEETRRLVAMNPTETLYQQLLGRRHSAYASALSRAGRDGPLGEHFDQALEIQQELVRQDPDNAEYVRELAITSTYRLETAIGEDAADCAADLERAINLYERLRAQRELPLHSRFVLGAAYAELGGYQRRSGQLEKAVASLQHGERELETLVRENPVVTSYRKALQHPLRELAEIEADTGRLAASAASFTRLAELLERLHGDQPEVAYLGSRAAQVRGRVTWLELQLGTRDASDCTADLEAAVAANVKDFHFQTALGGAYFRAGRFDEARSTLLRSTLLHPFAVRLKTAEVWQIARDAAQAQFYLAMTCARLGRTDEARAAVRKGDEWTDRFRKAIAEFPAGTLSYEDFARVILEPLRAEAAAAVSAVASGS